MLFTNIEEFDKETTGEHSIHLPDEFSQFIPPLESTKIDEQVEADNRADGQGNDDADEEVECVSDGEDESDKTIPTSADEILNCFINISDGDEYKKEKYSLRYWMAVILTRWPKMSEADIQEKFGIPRNTLKTHLTKNPFECQFAAPTKKKYAATTAEEIVDCLSQLDSNVEVNDMTYSCLTFVLIVITTCLCEIDIRKISLFALPL